MAKEIKLPDVGENVEKATVLTVHVQAGDSINADDTILEIETDKATLDVPAETGGTVEEVKVAEGDEISPGDVILTLNESGGEAEKPEGSTEEQPKAEPEKEEAKEDEAEPEEKPAEEEKSTPQKEPAPAEKKTTKPRSDGAALVPASPTVRRFAREIGVEIEDVQGSGPGGRITEDDVKAHSKATRNSGGGTGIAPIALPDFSKWGEIERKKASNIRRITAERLSQAWVNIPHVHHFEEADISELEATRKDFNELLDAGAPKVTLTAILLKFAALILRQYPDINATYDPGNTEIVYKDYIHIGVAVDTDRGLLVPVVRDVDEKDIVTIAGELNASAGKARDGKLQKEDMEGATFTITNLGGIGGVQFTPIINPPAATILGVSRGQFRLQMAEDETVEERLVLPLSFGYDHRLIDGATAARFMRDLAGYLANPMLSLFQM